jgi:hypothetical protein
MALQEWPTSPTLYCNSVLITLEIKRPCSTTIGRLGKMGESESDDNGRHGALAGDNDLLTLVEDRNNRPGWCRHSDGAIAARGIISVVKS